MVLVWGVRKHGQPERIKHAGILFDELEEDEATVVLPAIVVAEYITPLRTQKERERTSAALAKRFQVEVFDIRDAVLAAKLWNDGKTRREKAKPNVRTCLRDDTLIIATAVNRGAKVFYTEDDDCFDMAKRAGMNAKKLPTIGNLFEGV